MRFPQTLPSPVSGQREIHSFDVPVCCPVSKNPRPGSKLLILYYSRGLVLEVGALYAYLHQYQGGLRDDTGQLLIRDMEGMIHQVAADCANALGVPVTVCTDLVIVPKQHMYLFWRKKPLD